MDTLAGVVLLRSDYFEHVVKALTGNYVSNKPKPLEKLKDDLAPRLPTLA